MNITYYFIFYISDRQNAAREPQAGLALLQCDPRSNFGNKEQKHMNFEKQLFYPQPKQMSLIHTSCY